MSKILFIGLLVLLYFTLDGAIDKEITFTDKVEIFYETPN